MCTKVCGYAKFNGLSHVTTAYRTFAGPYRFTWFALAQHNCALPTKVISDLDSCICMCVCIYLYGCGSKPRGVGWPPVDLNQDPVLTHIVSSICAMDIATILAVGAPLTALAFVSQCSFNKLASQSRLRKMGIFGICNFCIGPTAAPKRASKA